MMSTPDTDHSPDTTDIGPETVSVRSTLPTLPPTAVDDDPGQARFRAQIAQIDQLAAIRAAVPPLAPGPTPLEDRGFLAELFYATACAACGTAGQAPVFSELSHREQAPWLVAAQVAGRNAISRLHATDHVHGEAATEIAIVFDILASKVGHLERSPAREHSLRLIGEALGSAITAAR